MSQDWANLTLGFELAKFSELSVHDPTVSSALCPPVPRSCSQPGRASLSTAAQNATCPQGQADLLGFIFFFSHLPFCG